MSEEKWNQFTVTGSVQDYLAYCACEHSQNRESERTGDADAQSYEKKYDEFKHASQERMT